MEAHTYILISLKDKKKYIGSTINLDRRLKEHFNGLVKSTKGRRPFKLFGFRIFDCIKEAAEFEFKYKKSHGQLERDIKSGKFVIIEKSTVCLF